MSYHSTDSELRHLWLGMLPPAQADRTRRHLVMCEKCLTRLVEIDHHGANAEPAGDRAHANGDSRPASWAR